MHCINGIEEFVVNQNPRDMLHMTKSPWQNQRGAKLTEPLAPAGRSPVCAVRAMAEVRRPTGQRFRDTGGR